LVNFTESSHFYPSTHPSRDFQGL